MSSHGLEKNDIFKNREDFIAGMNDVAICLIGCPISILAFCLMSNHFHFILYGTYEECRIFVQEYKRKCAMRMRRSAGEVKGLKGVQVQIDEIDSMEYLKEHPNIAQSTMFRETPEYLRGAINLLIYMKQFIENHNELVSEKAVESLAIDIWHTDILDLDESRQLAFELIKKGYSKTQ